MSTTLEQLQYGFDRNSRRIWQRRSLTDTQDQQYNYDALSQVAVAARGSLNLNRTAISGRPASAQSWDYDPTGNWRGYHSAANGTTTLDQHRVHDRGNRLTQIEGNPNSMILDRVGRMRQMAPDADGDWGGTLELTWDAWSRITTVKNNGEVVGDYAYDGSHRRITREVDGETLHSYYNDAWRPVEERKDAETTAAMSYLWGARHRDDLVRRDRAVGGTTLNETRYVLMDYFNPAAITDEAGEVKERYAFSAFGQRTILNPDFAVRSSSECGLGFGFQGQFLDVENGLMNYGYRYYSPYLGRWTCKDPIDEDGGFNIYVMAQNDPVDYVDLVGLKVVVNFNQIAPPIPGWCGDFLWSGTWQVMETKPEKFGVAVGILYQKVTIKTTIFSCDVPKRIVNQEYKERHEAWSVPVLGGDSWYQTIGKTPCSGETEFIGEAWFSTGAGEMPFLPNPGKQAMLKAGLYPADFAGLEINRLVEPKFKTPKAPKRESNRLKRSVKLTWDCCYGAALSQIKS